MKRTITLLQFLLFSSFLVAQGSINAFFQLKNDNTFFGLGKILTFSEGFNGNYFIVHEPSNFNAEISTAVIIGNNIETTLPLSDNNLVCEPQRGMFDRVNQVYWEASQCDVVRQFPSGGTNDYNFPDTGAGDISNYDEVSQIMLDSFYQPWLIIPDLGVQRLNLSYEWDEFFEETGSDLFLKNVIKLVADDEFSVWGVSSDSIKRFQNETWEAIEFPAELADLDIVDIDFQNGTIYVFFEKESFLKWEDGAWQTIVYNQPIEDITSAKVDHDGVIWFINQTGNFMDTYKVTAYYEGNITFKDDLPFRTTNEGLFFYQDNQGQLWFLDYGEKIFGNNDSYTNLYKLDFDFSTNSIQLQSATPQLKVSPNPSKGELQLQLTSEQTQQQARLLVRNLMGQTIYQQMLDLPSGKRDIILHLEHVPNGWYTITLSSANQEQTQKILIQK
ncbi:MAG: T9SS type A sorting domain-containing protein [Saprospiraceae bacterium]|nr:T9SS type A sorting domain-containing protein [Saprospiraceae bacterium]